MISGNRFITPQAVSLNMKTSVRHRLNSYATQRGWEHAHQGRFRYEKDGYELYFFNKDGGFELTVRNPETMERESVFEVRDNDICTASPAYVALLMYILENVEMVVSEHENYGN